MVSCALGSRVAGRLALAAALALVLGQRAQAQMGIFPPGTYYAGGGFYGGGFGLLPPGGIGAYGSNGYGIAVPAGGFEFLTPGYPSFGLGYSAFGQLPYSRAMAQARNAFLAAEFNPMNTPAGQYYQMVAANQQRAITEAFARYRPQVIEPHAKQPVPGTTAQIDTHAKAVQLISSDKLIDGSGNVLWPTSTPNDPKQAAAKQAAEAAIKKAAQDYRSTGRISPQAAADARDKLAAFGTPALDRLREQSPADAAGMELFLQSLDYSLNMMAGGPPAASPGLASRIDLTPGHSASTGADIRVGERKSAAPATEAPRPAAEPKKPARRIDMTPR